MDFPSPWNEQQIESELSYPGSINLVLDDGTSIIGWCCVRVVADEAELLKIAVRKDRHREGWGSMLLAAVIQAVISVGASQLFLEVRVGNHFALEFYSSHGFVEEGRRPGYYHDPVEDACIMRKELVAG